MYAIVALAVGCGGADSADDGKMRVNVDGFEDPAARAAAVALAKRAVRRLRK